MHCPVCKSNHFHRRHRLFAERLRYATIYECEKCHCLDRESHLEYFPLLSTVARCPECANTDLRVQPRLDPVDRQYRNPLSWLQKFLGAPLLCCSPCRLQFYDWRRCQKPQPHPAIKAAPASDSGRAASPAPAQPR
jgi:hypothetical protein